MTTEIFIAGLDISKSWSQETCSLLKEKYSFTVFPDDAEFEASLCAGSQLGSCQLFLLTTSLLSERPEVLRSIRQRLADPGEVFKLLLIEDSVSADFESYGNCVLQVPADPWLISSKLSRMLGDLAAQVNQICIKDAIAAVIDDYERLYKDEPNPQLRPAQLLQMIRERLKSRALTVYLSRPLTGEYVHHLGDLIPNLHSFDVSLLGLAPASSELCQTYVFEPSQSKPYPFQDHQGLMVVSKLTLDELPGIVIYTFNETSDQDLLVEICDFSSREIFHSLRGAHLRSQHRALTSLSQLAGTELESEESLWKAMDVLKEYFGAQGVSIVELLGTVKSGFHFRKTYTHHGRRDIEDFETTYGWAVEAVVNFKALIITNTCAESEPPCGLGFAFDPSNLSIQGATQVSAPYFRSSRSVENESSAMYFPLVISGEIAAALKVAHFERPNSFDLADLIDLSVLGGPIIGLLLHHRLSRELVDRSRHIQLREKISNQAENLFFYREIAQGVFHQLGNHLTAIRSALGMIEIHLSRTNRAIEVDTQLDEAIQYVKTAKELINDAHKRGMTLVPTNQPAQLVDDVVRPAIEYAQQRLSGTDILIRHTLTGSDYPVLLDIKLAKEGLINVLTNAIWAIKRNRSAGKKEILIAVREQRSREEVRIEVTDSGIGMDKDTYQQVATFSPFVSFREGGTGLGLYFTQRLLAHFGGKLAITKSQPGKGTTVTLTIPISQE